MTSTLRIIDTGQMTARRNVATTAALIELHRTGTIPDTLRFHRYPKSVLVGRHQVLSDVANVDRCKAASVELARRVTGGGAVYMAPGALAWDIVIARKSLGAALDSGAALICEAIASGLARLGLPARHRQKNDIEVDGRKICGSSGCFDGSTLAYQGTILVDTDLKEMGGFLRLPAASGNHQHRHLRQRVTTVARLLGRKPDAGEIENVVAAGVAHLLQRSLDFAMFAQEESALANRLHREQFGLDDFVETADPLRTGKALVGRDGRIQAHIVLHPGADRLIDQVWITGDFAVSPVRAIPDLEAALRGVPLRAAPERTIELLSDHRIELQGASPYDVAAAIADAAGAASNADQHTRPL